MGCYLLFGLSNPKYYAYNKTHKLYQVKKRMGDDWFYFGYYHTPEEAEEIVEHLKRVDWDKTKLPKSILDKINPSKDEVYKYGDSYKIIHKTDEGNKTYGVYPTRKEACIMSNILKEYNYNIYSLPYKFKRVILEKLKIREPLLPKYYSWDKIKKQYRVQRSIDGRMIVFGYYDLEADAIIEVARLKANNWKK